MEGMSKDGGNKRAVVELGDVVDASCHPTKKHRAVEGGEDASRDRVEIKSVDEKQKELDRKRGKEMFQRILSTTEDDFMGEEQEQEEGIGSQVPSTASENLERFSSSVSTVEISPKIVPKHGNFNEVETLLPPAIEIETSCEDVTESDTNRNKEVDEKTKAAMQVKPPQIALGNSSLANTNTTSSSFQSSSTTPTESKGLSSTSLGFGSFGGFSTFASQKEPTSHGASTGFEGFASLASKNSSSFSTFASSEALSVFGSVPTTAADFDDTEAVQSFASVDMDKDYKVVNGEENENPSYQVRSKLFRLGAEKDWSECGWGPLRILDPVVENRPVDAKTIVNDELGNGNGNAGNGNGNGSGSSSTSSSTSSSSGTSSSSRLVMRRETYAHGPGTRVILNMRLAQIRSVDRQGEKSVRVMGVECVDEKVQSVVYLMRFGSGEEADGFEYELSRRMQTH